MAGSFSKKPLNKKTHTELAATNLGGRGGIMNKWLRDNNGGVLARLQAAWAPPPQLKALSLHGVLVVSTSSESSSNVYGM